MTDKPHANIATALAAAQLEMGPALKDSSNPAFKSKYADLASVTGACMPALNKHGIAVIQPTVSDGMARAVKTIFIHGASGESLECTVDLIIGKNDMQGYGSAVTYARRYGLMCMAGIAPEDDDGNAAAQSIRDEPKSSGQALTQAWHDGVMDSLPPNATARQTAEAFAAAIADDFAGKGLKAMDNAWARHEKLINGMASKHPDLHGKIIDAYETRKNEMTETAQ